eukprot:3716089-Amphidinium_carterae.1
MARGDWVVPIAAIIICGRRRWRRSFVDTAAIGLTSGTLVLGGCLVVVRGAWPARGGSRLFFVVVGRAWLASFHWLLGRVLEELQTLSFCAFVLLTRGERCCLKQGLPSLALLYLVLADKLP